PETEQSQALRGSFRFYMAVTALVMLCGGLIFLLRSVSTLRGAAPASTMTARAAPSIAASPASAALGTTPSASVEMPATAELEVSAAPLDSVQVPAPSVTLPKAPGQGFRPQPAASVGRPSWLKPPQPPASAAPKAPGNLLDRTD